MEQQWAAFHCKAIRFNSIKLGHCPWHSCLTPRRSISTWQQQRQRWRGDGVSRGHLPRLGDGERTEERDGNQPQHADPQRTDANGDTRHARGAVEFRGDCDVSRKGQILSWYHVGISMGFCRSNRGSTVFTGIVRSELYHVYHVEIFIRVLSVNALKCICWIRSRFNSIFSKESKSSLALSLYYFYLSTKTKYSTCLKLSTIITFLNINICYISSTL